MSRLKISVIIIAHNRRKYLIDAIKSVQNQNFPKDYYEIIVVKNFIDENIDKYIEQNQILSIYTEKISPGEKHYLGISSSKGDLIVLLDDDDLFHPKKLSFVQNIFENNPDLIFYHNGMTFSENDILSHRELPLTRNKEAYLRSNYSKKDLRSLLELLPQYNSSSMAFTSSFAKKYGKSISTMYREIDPIWFLYSIEAGGEIMANDTPLTFYRRHEQGVSRSNETEKILWYSKQAIENYNILSNKLNNPFSKKLCNYFESEWSVKYFALNMSSKRRSLWGALISILRSHDSYISRKWYYVVLFLGIVGLFSKRIAIWVYPGVYK